MKHQAKEQLEFLHNIEKDIPEQKGIKIVSYPSPQTLKTMIKPPIYVKTTKKTIISRLK